MATCKPSVYELATDAIAKSIQRERENGQTPSARGKPSRMDGLTASRPIMRGGDGIEEQALYYVCDDYSLMACPMAINDAINQPGYVWKKVSLINAMGIDDDVLERTEIGGWIGKQKSTGEEHYFLGPLACDGIEFGEPNDDC
jgi:hypothetical protein